ncbi:Protein of unknown function [Bacillus mobilis]|nr:Protein of unknown function [Bacillus mobilis]
MIYKVPIYWLVRMGDGSGVDHI